MLHLKWNGIAKEWAFASRSTYDKDILSYGIHSGKPNCTNPFTRTENCKLRLEMTWNLTTMESLNFRLYEIVQLALVW